MASTYKNWRVETDADQILWLWFDRADSSVNTINPEVMEELNAILNTIHVSEISGVIFASAKKTGFIAGADITLFNQFHDIAEATSVLRRGQEIISRIEQLKVPTVAMIHGFCLGGGLELALGCRYRVAEEGPQTRLGLPEVKLGIYPGWGGSVRLPRLIGVLAAFDLIRSGKLVNAKTAEKLGFIDAAVPARHLVRAAKQYILTKPARRAPNLLSNLYELPLARKMLAHVMRKKMRAKINPLHYPAPFDVLANWEQTGCHSDAAMVREATGCGRLFFSETSQNLVRVFFLQEMLKGQAKNIQFKPQHVHVIGAGTMGGDIAAWCAAQGMRVTLQDRSAECIAPAIKRAAQTFREKLKDPVRCQQAMDRLVPDVTGQGVSRADVIIEAIFEDLQAKQDLFRTLEQQARPDAVLATNTSSILLDDINKVLTRPERLVGIHFFNPVAKMQLVEVVKGLRTGESVFEKALKFVRSIDRLPLPVKSSPGFLVNRILMPYLMDAMNLLESGVPAVVIDKAMTDFGMPMGPITLADTVGLDVCLSVANYLGQHFNMPVPVRLQTMVAAGKKGCKTGAGFYTYTKEGKQIKEKTVATTSAGESLENIADQLVTRMLDEAQACLQEGVVATADLLDAGMILGTGFAPFRGGPMHYAKTRGVPLGNEKIVVANAEL